MTYLEKDLSRIIESSMVEDKAILQEQGYILMASRVSFSKGEQYCAKKVYISPIILLHAFVTITYASGMCMSNSHLQTYLVICSSKYPVCM